MGMLQHANKDNLYIIDSKTNKKNALTAHFMDNFKVDPELLKIQKTLQAHGVNHEKLVNDLSEGNHSTESLAKRHNKLKSKLTAGTMVSVNEGSHAFSGGFHSKIPHPDKFIEYQGHRIPAPGPTVMVTRMGYMFTHDADGKIIPLIGDNKEKAAAIRKADRYNKGPVVFQQIPDNIFTGKRGAVVKMVVAQVAKGGQGLDFSDVGSSKEAYVRAMSGRGGAGDDLRFLDGSKSKHGYVTNALTNPWEKLPQTADDTAGDIAMSVGEFIGENSVFLTQTIGEIAMGGPAGLVMGAVNTVADQLGTGNILQEKINKLIGKDKRFRGFKQDIFAHAHSSVPGKKAFYSYDPSMIVDKRVEMTKDRLKSDYNVLKQQASKLGLSAEEQRKFDDLNVSNIVLDRDRGNQRSIMDRLELLAKNYKLVYNRMQKTEEMSSLREKAQKVGLGRATSDKTFEKMRTNMIIPPNYKPMFGMGSEDDAYNKFVEKAKSGVTSEIKKMKGTVPAIIQKMKDERSGFNKASQEQLVNIGLTKKSFQQVYSGKGDNESGQEFLNEFGKYQRQGWEAHQNKQGKYEGLSLNDFKNRDENFFVKKYLKNDPNALTLRDHDISELKDRYHNIRISENKKTELAQTQKKKSGFIVHFEKKHPSK